MTYYHVYALKRDKETFYIGQTKSPQGRLAKHKTTFGKNIEMEILDVFTCRMEAKWRERELCDDLFGIDNYRSNVLSEVLYPRELGNALAAKRRFISALIERRGRVPDIGTFGWDHYGYPTCSVPSSSQAHYQERER